MESILKFVRQFIPGFETIEKVKDIDVPAEIFHFIRIRLGLFAKEVIIRVLGLVNDKSTNE